MHKLLKKDLRKLILFAVKEDHCIFNNNDQIDGVAMGCCDQQKATLFNEFLASCQVHGRQRNHHLPPFRLLTTATLGLPQLSEANILQILKDLPNNKATGPEGIGNYIISATAVSIFRHILVYFLTADAQ